MVFFSNQEYEHLYSYIDTYFPNLKILQRTLLKESFKECVEKIAVAFCFDASKRSAIYEQFKENKGRDVMSLVLMLLPFVIDTDNLKNIFDLEVLLKTNKFSNRVIDFYQSDIPSIEEYVNENKRMLFKSIDLCSNKLYVNWITIRPVKESQLFTIPQYTLTEEFLKKQRDTPGVYIGDIYNSICSDLFRNIRRVKWLLYEVSIKGKLLSFDEIIKMFFAEMTEIEYNNVLRIITGQLSSSIESTVLINVLRYGLVYFESFYPSNIGNGYQKFRNDYDLEDNKPDYEFSPSDIPDEQVINNYKAMGPILWLNYLKDVYNIFALTWYSKKEHILYEGTINDTSFFVTRKNIYHFAKNFYFSNNNSWGELCYIWDELSDTEKIGIQREKFFFYENQTWFKTTRYLRSIYGSTNIRELTNAILRYIYENLAKIVVEVMFFKGVLSTYEPNTGYARVDEKMMQSSLRQIAKDEFINSYYYLTGRPYSNLVDGKYLTLIAESPKKYNWFFTYALDWLSQINFFNKMYHSRVNYITGSTGVGKSTQAPKLLLYGCQMIYYRQPTKVICSQPRISPTEINSIRIGNELGVPLDMSNYFIQYQHKEKRHVPLEYYNVPFIRLVTDGLLLEIINKNLTLMQTRKRTTLTDKNEYDVVIVDEAHEHNKNMDLILTFMKFVMKINFSVKLIIISATMDDDEPRYRSFYRDIVDQIQVPYDANFNRRFIDRRIHISPFGQTTRRKIVEYYFDREISTYEESESFGVSTVLNIANKDKDGEILFFSVGAPEIRKIVNYLNNSLPDSVIALPFFSELPPTYKSIFDNINGNLKKILYDRKYLLNILENDDWQSPNLPYPRTSSYYKRAVIIATNVAEASITIDTLRYVVDTGFNKKPIYEIETGLSVIKNTPISESSRLQRKGRVGRVIDGFVHYMYAKGSRSKIKTPYSICTEDVFQILLELMSKVRHIPLDSYNEVYKRYIEQGIITRPNDIELTLRQVLDPTYEFHLVHPDEIRINRDIYSGEIKELKESPVIARFYQILMRIPLFAKILNNRYIREQLAGLKSLVISDNITLFNIVSLVLAQQYGRNTFYKVAYICVGPTHWKIKLKGNLSSFIQTIEPQPGKSLRNVELKSLNINDGIETLYDILTNLSRHINLSVYTNLSEKEKVFSCLYLSYPINLCQPKNSSLYNVFSNKEISIPDAEKYSFISYIQNGFDVIHFPVSAEFLRQLNIPYNNYESRNLGTQGLVFYPQRSSSLS